MEIRSYNNELEYANLLFSKLFRNIVIERRIGNTLKMIPVPCMIGNRSRIFKNLENPDKKATYTFPLIVVERTGLQTEPDRIANLHNEVKYLTAPDDYNKGYYYDLMTPNPIAISYSVTVISKDQAMNDMIMSNFIPFFNQDLFVSSIHPKFTNVKYNSQVIFNGSVTEEHPSELQPEDDDFVTDSFDFTFKTYLFGGMGKRTLIKFPPDGSGGTSGIIYDGFVPIIKSVVLDIHAVPYLDQTGPNYISTEMSCYALSIREYPDGTSAYVSCDDGNGNPAIVSGMVETVSGYYDPYAMYSIDKYFDDISKGRWWPQDVDTFRWRIDDGDGKLKQYETNWWWIREDNFLIRKGINPYSDETSIDWTFEQPPFEHPPLSD